MSDFPSEKPSSGKKVFSPILFIVLVLILVGLYLSTRPNTLVSAEKIVPATGANGEPFHRSLYLRPQVAGPAANIYELGGGFILVENPDGSATMVTPFMAANTGD